MLCASIAFLESSGSAIVVAFAFVGGIAVSACTVAFAAQEKAPEARAEEEEPPAQTCTGTRRAKKEENKQNRAKKKLEKDNKENT